MVALLVQRWTARCRAPSPPRSPAATSRPLQGQTTLVYHTASTLTHQCHRTPSAAHPESALCCWLQQTVHLTDALHAFESLSLRFSQGYKQQVRTLFGDVDVPHVRVRFPGAGPRVDAKVVERQLRAQPRPCHQHTACCIVPLVAA